MKKISKKLKYALDIAHNQSNYVKTKNGAMIVFTSAMLIGIISNIENINKLII